VSLQFGFVDWLSAFVFTLGVELPVGYALLRRVQPSTWRVLLACALGSTLTHPTLWYVMPRFFSSYPTYLVTCELGIVVLEAWVLWLLAARGSWARAALTSATMNTASCFLGLAWSWLLA
jgi:uncharacterized membrane protein